MISVPDDGETVSVRLDKSDRPFLDEEALRIMQKEFAQTGRLDKPSIAEVISELLDELQVRRRQAGACSCGACTPPDEDTPQANLI